MWRGGGPAGARAVTEGRGGRRNHRHHPNGPAPPPRHNEVGPGLDGRPCKCPGRSGGEFSRPSRLTRTLGELNVEIDTLLPGERPHHFEAMLGSPPSRGWIRKHDDLHGASGRFRLRA